MRLSAVSILLACTLLGSTPTPCLSQEKDGDVVEESFIPNYTVGSLGFSAMGTADFDDGEGSLAQDEFEIQMLVPLVREDAWKLTTGISYRYNQLDFGGRELPFDNSLDLQRVEIPFNLWVDYSERWNFWFRASPGLFSDFDGINSDDFSLSVLALGSYQWTETLSVAVGGYYSRDLGEPTLLPAAGFLWKPDPHWSLALTVPRVEFSYAPDRDWLFTARAYPSGGGWNIDGVDGGGDGDLNLSSVRAGVSIDRRLFGKVWGSIDGGLQFAQKVELDGDGAADFDEDIDDTWFLNFGIKLRF